MVLGIFKQLMTFLFSTELHVGSTSEREERNLRRNFYFWLCLRCDFISDMTNFEMIEYLDLRPQVQASAVQLIARFVKFEPSE